MAEFRYDRPREVFERRCLAVLLLSLVWSAPVAAQTLIPDDDPRALLAAGVARPLLAGDIERAAAFVREHAAPSADVDGLLAELEQIEQSLDPVPAWRILDYWTGPDGESGGAGLSNDQIVVVATSGEPLRIADIMLFRLGPPVERFTTLNAVDRHLRDATAQDRFSGVVLAVRGNEPLFQHAYGHADRERGVSVATDTRFNLGSIDKAFTAVALLRLVQEGRVRLDDAVGRYVNGLSPEIASRVTIRHLLQHRGGVGDYLSDPQFQADPYRFATTDALLELIRERPLDFDPGSQESYSNNGFVLLGAVVEAVTGRPYHDIVREWVFEPAGMRDTGPAPDGPPPNAALGYSRPQGSPDAPLARSSFRAPSSPAGGGYATAADLQRFLRALQAERLLDGRHTDIMLNNFQEPARPGLRPARYSIAGGAPGINAYAAVDRTTDEIVIVLTNVDPPAAEALGSALLRQLAGFP